MANNHDSLIREVQEELDREKYEKLWEKYGNFVIGGAIAIVVAVGGYQYWQKAQRTFVEKAGGAYEAALAVAGDQTSKDYDASKVKSAFEPLLKDAPGGYKVLAQLQIAGAHVAAGEKKEALAVFEELSKTENVDTILHDYAALQAASLRVGDADWTEMENRLKPLVSGSSAWRNSALQLKGIAAFQAGRIDEAREVFDELLSNPKAPSSIRDRASLYMARIVAVDMAAEHGDAKAVDTQGSPAAVSGPSDKASSHASGANGDGLSLNGTKEGLRDKSGTPAGNK